MGGQRPRPGHFTHGKDPAPIVQEAGWAPGPVCTGAENLAPQGFDTYIFPVTYTHLGIPIVSVFLAQPPLDGVYKTVGGTKI